MYRFALLVGGLVLIVGPAAAQPDSLLRTFKAANEAYAEGQYKQAIADYRSVLDAGYESGALYHNLGNAYTRLDRVGPAVWAYERGRRLRPDDPRLRHNLEYVRRRAGLPVQGLPPRGLAALVAGWSPLLLFGIGVLALGAGLLGAVFRAGPDRALAWRSPTFGVGVGGGLLLVVMALGTSYVQTQERRSVVMSEKVSLREDPTERAVSDTTLKEGSMLEVRGRRDGWVRVRLRDQTVGWVPAGEMGEV